MKNFIFLILVLIVMGCSKDESGNNCEDFLIHTFWEYKSTGETVPNTTVSTEETLCGSDRDGITHGTRIILSENESQRYVKFYN